jgi:type II secretory pathway pseudopilin PulG
MKTEGTRRIRRKRGSRSARPSRSTPLVGFTLVELLVVVSLIALLIGMLAPSVVGILSQMRRANCRTNLREIAQAIRAYADDNPLHRDNIGGLPSVGPITTNWGDPKNGNAASLWLLATGQPPGYVPVGNQPYEEGRSAKLSSKLSLLLCPEAEVARSFRPPQLSDKQMLPETCSYSYFSMVIGTAAGTDSNYPTLGNMNPTTVIVGDQNPRCTVGQSSMTANLGVNSRNHRGLGQNAARLGGSVEWADIPAAFGEDIYGASKVDANGATTPADLNVEKLGLRGNVNDTFLIP